MSLLPTSKIPANDASLHDGREDNTAGGAYDTSAPEIAALMGCVRTMKGNFVSGVGVAGVDNTAQAVKTISMPANTLQQVGDRCRIRCYWAGTTGNAVTATLTLNGVTVSHSTDAGAADIFLDECWLHYVDATHANLIEVEGAPPGLGALSAPNVSGFDWAQDQNVTVSQNQVANNHIIVYMMAVDIFPKNLT